MREHIRAARAKRRNGFWGETFTSWRFTFINYVFQNNNIEFVDYIHLCNIKHGVQLW